MLKFLAAALVAGAITAGAQAADDLPARFGAREAVSGMHLSPDGTHVAWLARTGTRGRALMVADLGGDAVPRAVLHATGNPEQLESCQWSTDSRLVCRLGVIQNDAGDLIGFSRLIALNSDGSKLVLLSNRTNIRSLEIMQNGGGVIDWTGDGHGGTALVTRTYVPESTIDSNAASSKQGLGVDRIDTTTLARTVVEPPHANAVEYISDGRGTVRIMGIRPATTTGYDSDHLDYYYRAKDKRDWRRLGTVTFAGGVETGFDPYAVDRDLDVAYGTDTVNGRTALYKVALDGSMKRELVMARPDVDVGDLARVGRQQRVVGASYVTDRRQTEFFDPELKRLQTSLGKALPGQLITFVDASAVETRLLLFVGGDTDPGRYYLFDKGTHHLAQVLPVRPQLAGLPLATVKAITYRAADGTAIPAYLTVPAGHEAKDLPAIVMPHGGPGARDEWGFDWLSQYFAARGYAVIQPNFRGSTGYGESWFKKNGFQSWRTAIGDVNDAGRYLLSAGIARPGKLAIVGWSYGGYAALQSAVLDPDLFKAVVAVAPVTDLKALKEEHRHYADYATTAAFIGDGPQLRDGSPAQNADRIKAPVLLFHGDMDQHVGIAESRLMASRLRGAGAHPQLIQTVRKLFHRAIYRSRMMVWPGGDTERLAFDIRYRVGA